MKAPVALLISLSTGPLVRVPLLIERERDKRREKEERESDEERGGGGEVKEG